MQREEVSHELRTPLTTVKGVLQLLASGRLPDCPERAAEMVQGAWRQVVALEEVVGRVEALFHDGPDGDEAHVLAVEDGFEATDR